MRHWSALGFLMRSVYSLIRQQDHSEAPCPKVVWSKEGIVLSQLGRWKMKAFEEIVLEMDKEKEGILTAEQIGNELSAFIRDTFLFLNYPITQPWDQQQDE